MSQTQAAPALARLRDPQLRYRHGRLIHGLRVAIGIFLSLGITYGVHVPNGEWTAISFLIVMASLHHHGNIRRRALERAAGTLAGAAAGLVIIGIEAWLGATPLTFLLMAAFCGFCGYHAISRGGYLAQLAAITLIIVAGYGQDPISVGLWRTVNVLLGIVIALALSFTLPLYARDYWRFGLAEALRRCARLLAAEEGPAAGVETVSPVLNRLRPLMAPVARETRVPLAELEAIQRCLRLVLSLLEVATDPELPAAAPAEGRPRWVLTALERARIGGHLAALAEGLENGTWPERAPDPAVGQSLAARTVESQLDQLRHRLVAAPALWRVRNRAGA